MPGGGCCREPSRFTLAADQRGGGSFQHLDLAEFLSWHMGSRGASWPGPRRPTSRGVCRTDQMAPEKRPRKGRSPAPLLSLSGHCQDTSAPHPSPRPRTTR